MVIQDLSILIQILDVLKNSEILPPSDPAMVGPPTHSPEDLRPKLYRPILANSYFDVPEEKLNNYLKYNKGPSGR